MSKYQESKDYSSEEEDDPIVDQDTCNNIELQTAFPTKYQMVNEFSVSLKKVYILKLCSDKSFGRIVAGLSNESVQLFDINNGALTLSSTGSLSSNTLGAICGVRFLDETPHNLIIGSTGGDISLYDLRTGKVERSYEESPGAVKEKITSFDVNANGLIICSGTEKSDNVYLQFFDVRQEKTLGSFWDSHHDDVTDVKFHPTLPDVLCTGSTDGLINIFNIAESCEDDALQTTVNTENSVMKLNWHKNVYEKDIISCITGTNDLKIYEAEEGDSIAEFERSQITETIKRTSAECCNLVSCHNLLDGGLFAVANSYFNRGEVVRSVQLQGKKLIPHAIFDENRQRIRESLHDPKSNLLVTAGESGIVTLWSPDTSLEQKSGPNKLKAKSSAAKPRAKKPY